MNDQLAQRPVTVQSGSRAGGELDERKARILRSIVERYIETAQPVGSTQVVHAAALDVSAATVRNDMAFLEEEGYLIQPHTSAGRIPTDKGYRFFVDGLPAFGQLLGSSKETVRQFFSRTHGELDQLLTATSRLLSTLTRYAAVVMAPDHDAAVVRSAQLVYLGSRTVLAILVLSDGAVVRHALDLDEDITEANVESAARQWVPQIVGGRLSHPAVVAHSGDRVVDSIITAAEAAVSLHGAGEGEERLFVGGAARMAESFDAIETVRSVLSILEQHILVVSLLKGALEGDHVSVAIGSEHGVEPLSDCSVVVAPCRFANDEVGLIGVLGPTRMHYEKAIRAVSGVGTELESLLGEAPGPPRR